MAGRAATPARTDIAAGAAARTNTAVTVGRRPGSRAERAAVGTAADPDPAAADSATICTAPICTAPVSTAPVSTAPVSSAAVRAGTGIRPGTGALSPGGPATGPPA